MKLKSNKGFSLIEVIVSMAVLIIVFTMLSVIITTYYKQHIDIGVTKSQRVTQFSNFEKMLANDAADANIGTVKITLDTSSLPNESNDTEYNCNIVKKNYGGNKNLYVYAKP